uniref:Uncharacterized protein n=1 Tax=Rhizophora mucronata TaxID=61149 RepID=A0A2P2NHF2_RHIMU
MLDHPGTKPTVTESVMYGNSRQHSCTTNIGIEHFHQQQQKDAQTSFILFFFK